MFGSSSSSNRLTSMLTEGARRRYAGRSCGIGWSEARRLVRKVHLSSKKLQRSLEKLQRSRECQQKGREFLAEVAGGVGAGGRAERKQESESPKCERAELVSFFFGDVLAFWASCRLQNSIRAALEGRDWLRTR